MDYIEVVLRIKKELNLSQREMARNTGLSNQWINQILRRLVPVSARSKQAITYALYQRLQIEIQKHREAMDHLFSMTRDLLELSKED